MTRIPGRVAIVTGSSSGNGRAIALTLANEGAFVVCSDIRPEPRDGGYEEDKTPTHELIAKTGKSIFQKTDVRQEEDIKELVAVAVKTYGRLDIMINNAAIFQEPVRIENQSVAEFEDIMAVNTRGVFLGMKHAILQMMKQDPLPSGERGWIVNIASIGAKVALKLAPSYCASKGAVLNLTRQVAIDYAPDKIHVNGVCPGLITTAMARGIFEDKESEDDYRQKTPWPTFGAPENVAKAVLFLASEDSGWSTGSFVDADGGFLAN